jgi:hypothetical protein
VITKDRLVIVLVPKTGSSTLRIWAQNYLKPIRGKTQSQHDYPDFKQEGREPVPGKWGQPRPVADDAFIYGVARDPVEWLRSFWCYRIEQRWANIGAWPLDHIKVYNKHIDTFEGFIEQVLEFWPGYVGDLYERMLGHAHYVGNTRTMAEDTLRAMDAAGVTCLDPRDRRRAYNHIAGNRKNPSGPGLKELQVLSTKLELDLIKAEARAIEFCEWKKKRPPEGDLFPEGGER